MRFIKINYSKQGKSCVPHALTVLLNKPYEDVNSYLRYVNARRHDNSGTYTERIPLSDLGFVPLDKSQTPEVSLNQFYNQLVKSGDKGSYLVKVRGHVLAIKKGFIHDTIDSSKRVVVKVWRQNEISPMGLMRFEDKVRFWKESLQKKVAKVKAEKKIKEFFKKKKIVAKKVKLKKAVLKKDPQYMIEQLEKRKKTWTSKLKRAKTAISKIDKKIKYYNKKNTPAAQILSVLLPD